jgi:hypothetical protein
MKHEFKVTKSKDQTVYTLESATGGSSSTAGGATVSTALGGVRRRGDNLLAQEADKNKVPATTPRNFVAKNAKTSGAGAHTDKKKAAKQGDVKHKKPFAEEGVAETGPAATAAIQQGLNPTEVGIADRTDKYNTRWNAINAQKAQQMLAKGLDPTKTADWDKFGKQGVAEGKEEKIAQLKKDHETAVHWSKNEKSPQKREAARQKAEKIKRHLDTQYKQGVAEAPDSNFVGFMNKTLGQKTDAPVAKSVMPNFMKDAPVAGLDSMGYRAALNFGMKTLNKLTPTQKTKLSIKGEDGVVSWLASQANKQGLLITDEEDDTPGKFMEEDLQEVQDFLPEVFKDPAIKSWAFVLTDGEPLPKAPVAGPFTVSINPGLPNDNGYANSDWKELDTLENLPDAVELAQGLAQRNPKQFVGIWTANGKNAGFYWPGQGWRGLKEGVAEGFNGEYDDEAGMAHSNLLTTARAVMGLLKTIKDRDNLPEWGQEKIAKAEMMLVSVWDYLQSQKELGNDPQVDTEEGAGRPFRGVGGACNRGDDERHDLDPTDWYVVKDGKMFAVSVYPNQEREATARGYSRTRAEAKAKASEQGVAEADKKGLYYYVNKRKKAGTSRDADSPKAPTAQAWKDAAKTAKKEGADTYFESLVNKLDELKKKK